jgi:2'-5' RNA ligase
VDHVVVPLDRDHEDALDELIEGIRTAAGMVPAPARSHPHITLITHQGLPVDQVAAAIAPVVTAAPPFTVHAHGYGIFTGPSSSELSLHVPIVSDRRLNALHRELCSALRHAGAEIAGWTEPDRWTPHVTLVDRDLDPARLGRAAAWLAPRHHPSWNIPVREVSLIGPRAEWRRIDGSFPLGAARA